MGGDKEKILIVLVAGIGDLVLGSPAMRSIRNGHPDAEIHLLTNRQAIPVAKNYDFIDAVWPFPIRDILRNSKGFTDGLKTVSKLRRMKFKKCVNLFRIDSSAGCTRMGVLFTAVGAKERIGHDAHGFGRYLTASVPEETFGNGHVAESMLAVACAAGGVPDEKGLEIHWEHGVDEKCAKLAAGGGGPLVGINPGGDRRTKRWPIERFGEVAARLANERGARVLVFGGPGEEEYADKIVESAGSGAVESMAGKLSLSELACVASRLDLFITNDSGPMHIAAAAGAPLLCIFGPDDPGRTRPYVPRERYIIVKEKLECQPCFSDECEHVRCMCNIGVDQICEAAFELLDRAK